MSGRGMKRFERGRISQKAKLASTHVRPSEPSARRHAKASARTPERTPSHEATDAIASDVQAYGEGGVLGVHLLGQVGHRYRRESGQRHTLRRPQRQ